MVLIRRAETAFQNSNIGVRGRHFSRIRRFTRWSAVPHRNTDRRTEGAAAYCNSELDCGFEEMTISSGTKLGRYEIRSKIGQGGMGEANRVQQTKLMRINRR